MDKPVPQTTYVSSDKLMRIFVESVSQVDDDFYLVSIIDEPSKDDMYADGDELTNSEWRDLVKQFGLERAE
ncbi:hypothetical protein [Photobacterium marinum]|nr:hypothetical protein [Photobacterium marinum]